MSEAHFTLTLPGLSHDGATAMAESIDDDLSLAPLAVTINETDEARGLWDVVLYFADHDEARNASDILSGDDGLIAPVPERDWVRQSLEGLAPVTAGRFFLYGSHDRHRRRSGGISLEIDAGTAFGTGHHGTTEGCLTALDRILKQRTPQNILDIGCGTGVLAIAAAKATGHNVLASDIDPEAVRVCMANAALNGVNPLVHCFTAAGLRHPGIAARHPHDLIFANILARPLVSLASDLCQALAPGGDLILSGLTVDQIRWVEAAYRNRGLVVSSRITRGNWATLVLTAPQKKKHPGGRTPGRFSAGARGTGWEEA